MGEQSTVKPDGVYVMTYHRDGWTLADAFRPQPGWGTRRFTVKAADLGPHEAGEVVEAAREHAPERYRLTSVVQVAPGADDRVIWSTAPDPRFASLAKAEAA